MDDLEQIISIIEDRAEFEDFEVEQEAVDIILALLEHFGEDVKEEIKINLK